MIARFLHSVLGALLVIGSTLCSTQLIADGQADDKDSTSFIIHNFEFVLLHELAHAIISDLEIPVLGPLEDTADYLAISMAINGDQSAEGSTFLRETLQDTARSFFSTWRLANTHDAPVPYWDTHSLSIQRYYSVVCLLVGSNPARYRLIQSEIPRARAQGCEAEYKIANAGFNWLLQNHTSDKKPVAEIRYRFERTITPTQRKVVDELKRLNLVENTVGAIKETFGFKSPIEVTLRTCAQPNAFWSPEQRELLICYELFDAFAQVHQYQLAESADD